MCLTAQHLALMQAYMDARFVIKTSLKERAMLIIDWVFDKLGYTRKVTFDLSIFAEPSAPAKITTKKVAAKKATGKKAAPRKRRLG